ncbi:hypothetical protein J0H33_12865 [bacterium]|jgi:hypothetical protein|nr:hypothetical protein [bacterium]
MATAVVARPVARPQERARDEEVLVWPDLVFVEFISAMVFTLTIFLLSAIINAPLLDEANADVTPNPSKAPWYFLNLQELLLHMDKGLAGVIVPAVWLGLMAIFPYFDTDNEGQGVWFGTENAVKITVVSGIISFVGTWLLILWDNGNIAQYLNGWFGLSGGDSLRFLENARAFQSQLPWPEWSTHIPYLWFDLTLLDQPFHHLNFPAWLVEQAIPVAFMVGLPTIMVYVLWRVGWVRTRRDALLSIFTGFVVTMGVLTIVGTAFRSESEELVWPWQLKLSEGIPGQE